MEQFKLKLVDWFSIKLDHEDGTPRDEWKVCFDYASIARAEDLLKIDIKSFDVWPMPSSKLPELVWCGLGRFNPNVTLEEVKEALTSVDHWRMFNEIYFMIHPWAREHSEKLKRTGATADPNPQTATSKT